MGSPLERCSGVTGVQPTFSLRTKKKKVGGGEHIVFGVDLFGICVSVGIGMLVICV